MQQRRIWLTLLAVGGLAAALTAYFATLGPPQNPPQTPRSARIEYRASGTAGVVAISYLNDIGVEERRELAPPWTFGFRARQGRTLTLTVTRIGDTGAVGCAIAANGTEIVAVPAEGERAEATCQSAVP